MKWNKIFDKIWWGGFCIAILFIFLIQYKVIENSSVILFYGISHMILLTVTGMYVISMGENNIDIGHRVSTMGYLHTLIGTTIALILTSHHNQNADILTQMNLIILPIGSALITSIIGWAVGTEMERTVYASEEESVLDKAALNFSRTIDRLGGDLDKSTLRWQNNIDLAINKLNDSMQNSEKIYSDMLSKSSKKLDTDADIILKKYFIIFDRLFNKIAKQMGTVQDSFDESSTNTLEVITELLLSYKNFYRQMQNNVEKIDKNLNQSANKADKSINNFILSFEKLFSTLETYSNDMQTDFKNSSDEAQKTMDGLNKLFSEAFSQINVVSGEWETHIEKMQDFSEKSTISLGNLLNKSKIIAKEIDDVANGLPSSAKILREVDDILEVLRMIKDNHSL